MSPFFRCHPSDLYVAWVAGLCVGVWVGLFASWLGRKVDARRINRHSQEGSDGATF